MGTESDKDTFQKMMNALSKKIHKEADAKQSLSFLLNAYRETKDLSRAFTTILHSKHPTMAGSQSEELSKDEMEKMSKLSAANARESAKSDPIWDNLSKGSNKKGPQVITESAH